MKIQQNEPDSNVRKLLLSLTELVEAVEYTPLGVRGIFAVANARSVLSEVKESFTNNAD